MYVSDNAPDSVSVLEDTDTANTYDNGILETVDTDTGGNITVVINNPVPDAVKDTDTIEIDTSTLDEELVLTDVDVTLKSVSADDTTGLKSVVLSVIGDYDTVVTDYTYQSGSYTSHNIDVQPDYAWLTTAFIFVVCLYSMFRLYGLLFGKGRR